MTTPTSVITIERFIMEQERLHPEATGELSNLLYDVCLAAKIISRNVRRAGLTDILGGTSMVNVSGELQQKLDIIANETVRNALQYTGRICVLASEEDDEPVPVPASVAPGKYVILYDPLDGSSNIDVNVSIGTIFSIHRRVTPGGPGRLADCLQAGLKQVASGYILYGSSTMLVYTTGNGVHGFTLDPTIGEFLLSHPDIRSPDVGKYYSVNESHWNKWTPGIQRVVGVFKNGDSGRVEAKNARYIGSLVADIHRNLMSGGVFLYPADTASPEGKLRLLYEAAPLAFVAEQAGGAASNGRQRIMEMAPSALHQRTPLFLATSSWSRYSWYLRLPYGAGHPWAGVIRCEASADLDVPSARRLADGTATCLPRFASRPHKDTRAPQNLYPIGGLERHLKRLLGDAGHVLRPAPEALRFAQESPERVSGLVLIAPSGIDYPDAFDWWLMGLPVVGDAVSNIMGPNDVRNLLEKTVHDTSTVTDTVVDEYWAPGSTLIAREALVTLQRDLDWTETERDLSGTEAPTLVFWGDQDAFAPYELHERFRDEMPDASSVVLEGCGHSAHEECTSEVLSETGSFLAELP